MAYQIAVLPGDGIGVDVTAEAVKVLQAVGERFGHRFEFREGLIGAAAIEATGEPLPAETLALCRASQAILLGAVGHPRYDEDPTAPVRPEQGLLALRKGLGLYANLRPARTIIPGGRFDKIDLMVVRENLEGLYIGHEHYVPIDGDPAGARAAYEDIPFWCSQMIRACFSEKEYKTSPHCHDETVGTLVDPDAAPAPVTPPVGDYRCRTVKLGSQGGDEGLGYVVYGWFACRIETTAGGLKFVKRTGSQRPAGLLFPENDREMILLGSMALASEAAANSYGQRPDRDMVAVLERIGDARWRLVIPWPQNESNVDLIELVPAR